MFGSSGSGASDAMESNHTVHQLGRRSSIAGEIVVGMLPVERLWTNHQSFLSIKITAMISAPCASGRQAGASQLLYIGG
jgi:hypothetical protein